MTEEGSDDVPEEVAEEEADLEVRLEELEKELCLQSVHALIGLLPLRVTMMI